MIEILEKQNCCGCAACVQVCPVRCISFEEDREGFRYPLADAGRCIGCNLCEAVCPVLHPLEKGAALSAFAAKASDPSLRKASSSGGIFSLLAGKVIRSGGVVFGARFDREWEVVHDYSETEEGLSAFRGSKYMQSRMETAFRDAKRFLDEGRSVLFSGTPCQIRGLHGFLRKAYSNLISVDVVCHGVPSPKVWRNYLDARFAGKRQQIRSILFRDKTAGWEHSSFAVDTENFTLREQAAENPFMKAFLADYILRPSCHACPAKSCACGSDITLGDFWGIRTVHPSFYDGDGVSAVLLRTRKGKDLFAELPVDKVVSDEGAIRSGNPALCVSSARPADRDQFWQDYLRSGRKCLSVLQRATRRPLKERIIRNLKKLLR